MTTPVAEGVFELTLDPALEDACAATLTVRVADNQGNDTALARTFSVGATECCIGIAVAEYAEFASCLAGPEAQTPPACSPQSAAAADRDNDGDIDRHDAAILMNGFFE